MVIRTKLKKFYQKNNNIIKKSLQLIQIVSDSKFIKEKKSIDFLTNQTKCKNPQKQQQSNKLNTTSISHTHVYNMELGLGLGFVFMLCFCFIIRLSF